MNELEGSNPAASSSHRPAAPTSLALPQHQRVNYAPSPFIPPQAQDPHTARSAHPSSTSSTPSVPSHDMAPPKRPAPSTPITSSPEKRPRLDSIPPFAADNISHKTKEVVIERRTNPESSPLSSLQATPIQPLQLALSPSLPLPLLLLTYAQTLHNSALALEPLLAQSNIPPVQYSQYWAKYQQCEAGAIAALRSVIAGAGGSSGFGFGGGRLELRARILLVEILGKTVGTGEAEKVVAKGLAAAQKHEGFAIFKYHLYAQQISLAVKSSNTKFAKATLKRVLSENSLTSFPHWLYHFQLSLSTICIDEKDYPGALNALREVESIATKRGDEEMMWTAKVLIARLALGAGEIKTAGLIIDEVADMLGFTSTVTAAPGGIPGASVKGEEASQEEIAGEAERVAFRKRMLGPQLTIQFVLVYCLYQAEAGNIKLAKEKLKVAHALLDKVEIAPGENEGWVKIPLRPVINLRLSTSASTSNSAKLSVPVDVTLQLAPRSMAYTFTFLASVAIHRDPYGSKPRALLFSQEGIRTLDSKLGGHTALPPSISPASIKTTLANLAKTKVYLHLLLAEIHIMRSEFSLARSSISTAISTSRSQPGLWEVFAPRITLDQGLLYQALGKDEEALECFETVIDLLEFPGIPLPGASSSQSSVRRLTNLEILAKASIIIIQFTRGAQIRLTDSDPSSARRKSGALSLSIESQNLNDLARQIVQNTSPSSSNDAPTHSMRLIGEIVQSFTKGAITTAKVHLAAALMLSNEFVANHAKAAVLALLTNIFLFTRDDQAQKMAWASYLIARGMGSKSDGKARKSKTGEAPFVNPPARNRVDEVGNARLGLWLGGKMLDWYKRDVENSRPDDPNLSKRVAMLKEQEEVNEAHRSVVKRDGL